MSASSFAQYLREFVGDHEDEIRDKVYGSDASGVAGSIESVLGGAEEILEKAMSELFPKALSSVEYEVTNEKESGKVGYVYLNFDPETLIRQSLNPKRQLDDIAALFQTGFQTDKNTPFGTWHNYVVKGWSSRAGVDWVSSVIGSAVKEIKSTFTGVKVSVTWGTINGGSKTYGQLQCNNFSNNESAITTRKKM